MSNFCILDLDRKRPPLSWYAVVGGVVWSFLEYYLLGYSTWFPCLTAQTFEWLLRWVWLNPWKLQM